MPTLRNNPSRYVLELDAQEFTLITRSIGLMAGMDISVRGEDRPKARDLNERLLRLRWNSLQNELKGVEDALAKVEASDVNLRGLTKPMST